MQSFFGLADLISVDENFYGVPGYASTLTWELVTNATMSSGSWPSEDEISVRFLFHNGTTSNISQPTEYPLFGTNQSPLPWSEFVTHMNKFAIVARKTGAMPTATRPGYAARVRWGRRITAAPSPDLRQAPACHWGGRRDDRRDGHTRGDSRRRAPDHDSWRPPVGKQEKTCRHWGCGSE
jgi:hypothetical protein